MLRFSANLGFLWPDRPLLARIEAAAKAGFRAIEMHWPYDTSAADVLSACSRQKLEALAVNTAVGNAAAGEFGLAALPGREFDFEKSFDQAVDYSRVIGAKAIHVMAGVTPEAARDEAARTLVRNLRLAAEKAPDLTLLLEPINPRDRPGYFYSKIDQAARIIEAVDAPNLRIMFDAYHVGVSEGDILTKLRHYLPIIGHVQIAAVPSRAEPDEGEISYPAVFAALEDLGYDGWVGCEYRPRTTTDEGLAWIKTLGVSLTDAQL